jgi:hypothetical protein
MHNITRPVFAVNMSILSIDLHSSKSTIRLSFHFQNVPYESLDDIYCSKFSTGCNPHMLGWRPQPCISSRQLDVGCPVVIVAAIPVAMLLPTDECFAQEVPEHVYDGLTCPKYALSTRTVRNRLKSAGLKSRRVIKRPLLADRHRRSRLAWCLARRGWNLRT